MKKSDYSHISRTSSWQAFCHLCMHIIYPIQTHFEKFVFLIVGLLGNQAFLTQNGSTQMSAAGSIHQFFSSLPSRSSSFSNLFLIFPGFALYNSVKRSYWTSCLLSHLQCQAPCITSFTQPDLREWNCYTTTQFWKFKTLVQSLILQSMHPWFLILRDLRVKQVGALSNTLGCPCFNFSINFIFSKSILKVVLMRRKGRFQAVSSCRELRDGSIHSPPLTLDCI